MFYFLKNNPTSTQYSRKNISKIIRPLPGKYSSPPQLPPACKEALIFPLALFCSLLLFISEKAVAPHSTTLAWKIPWTEEPGGQQSMGSLRVGHDFHFSLSCIGEGNGNPLQCSCLENPRDRGAWWAAAYGVAQSRTRLK